MGFGRVASRCEPGFRITTQADRAAAVVYSPAAEEGNPALLDSLLIISLWDMCNNIQVGVEFSPLGN